jgi:branched-chain amino acid transport system permease protein
LGEYTHIFFVLIILLFMPVFIPIPTASTILIYGLYAMGYNVALGYTGMLSFGHAAFFGLGAYGAGIALRYFNTSVWTGLLSGVILASFFALIIGALCVRKRGVYFALLIAAFGQMFYFIALSPLKHITGGEDGLKGIRILTTTFPFSINLAKPYYLFLFIFFIVAVSILLMHRLLNSPFGSLLQGIRENEKRLRACGYNTNLIKVFSFTISGLFSGLAGALFTIFLGYVPLTSLYWLTSGTALLMTLLGGFGTFFGPLLGAGIFIYFEDTISAIISRWEIIVGGLFIFLILVFPDGVLGTIMKKFGKSKDADIHSMKTRMLNWLKTKY